MCRPLRCVASHKDTSRLLCRSAYVAAEKTTKESQNQAPTKTSIFKSECTVETRLPPNRSKTFRSAVDVLTFSWAEPKRNVHALHTLQII